MTEIKTMIEDNIKNEFTLGIEEFKEVLENGTVERFSVSPVIIDEYYDKKYNKNQIVTECIIYLVFDKDMPPKFSNVHLPQYMMGLIDKRFANIRKRIKSYTSENNMKILSCEYYKRWNYIIAGKREVKMCIPIICKCRKNAE